MSIEMNIKDILRNASRFPVNGNGMVKINISIIKQAYKTICQLEEELKLKEEKVKDTDIHEEAITTLLYRVLENNDNEHGVINIHKNAVKRALDTINGYEEHIRRLKKKNHKRKKKINKLIAENRKLKDDKAKLTNHIIWRHKMDDLRNGNGLLIGKET